MSREKEDPLHLDNLGSWNQGSWPEIGRYLSVSELCVAVCVCGCVCGVKMGFVMRGLDCQHHSNETIGIVCNVLLTDLPPFFPLQSGQIMLTIAPNNMLELEL